MFGKINGVVGVRENGVDCRPKIKLQIVAMRRQVMLRAADAVIRVAMSMANKVSFNRLP